MEYVCILYATSLYMIQFFEAFNVIINLYLIYLYINTFSVYSYNITKDYYLQF